MQNTLLKTASLVVTHFALKAVFQSRRSEISSLEIESFMFTILVTVEVSYLHLQQ